MIKIYSIFTALILFSLSCRMESNQEEHKEHLSESENNTESISSIEPYIIEVDSSLIDPLFADIGELKELGYDTITYNEKLVTSIKNDLGSCEITFFNVNEWEGVDPGDYRKVVVNFDSKETVFLNLDGWIMAPKKLKKNHEYFILEDIGLKYKSLIFVGYSYASEAPFLTIIGFDNEGAKLVYNKKKNIVDIQNNELIVTNTNGEYSRIYGLDNRIIEYKKDSR